MGEGLRRTGRKFYPAYLWLVTRALNEQTEFKVAEKDGQVGFYDCLTPLYAVFHEDDKTFSLMWTEFDENFGEFYAAYERDGRVLLPLCVTCHHAATDGRHMSRFLEKLQSDMDRFAEITE